MSAVESFKLFICQEPVVVKVICFPNIIDSKYEILTVSSVEIWELNCWKWTILSNVILKQMSLCFRSTCCTSNWAATNSKLFTEQCFEFFKCELPVFVKVINFKHFVNCFFTFLAMEVENNSEFWLGKRVIFSSKLIEDVFCFNLIWANSFNVAEHLLELKMTETTILVLIEVCD